MRKVIKLNENDLYRLVRRAIQEQEEEFPLKSTVESGGAFEEGEIPQECLGENSAGMSQVDMIGGCLGKINEKSINLNKTIQALTELLNKTKTEAESTPMAESRRFRRNRF
jgi:vacuolar-type H+-ATPase subunit E/Vma4